MAHTLAYEPPLVRAGHAAVALPAGIGAAAPCLDCSIPGMRIHRHAAGARWPLVVRAKEQEPDWAVRRESDLPCEMAPAGATIRYAGVLYMVAEAEQTPHGWVYRFAEWPRDEPIHRLLELTPDAVAQERSHREELMRNARLSTFSILYEIPLGFLPARLQNRLSERVFFSPADASGKSGFVQFLVFFALTALSLIHAFANAIPPGNDVAGGLLAWALVCFAVAVEGGVRWGHAAGSDHPIGFLPLALVDRVLFRSEYRRQTACPSAYPAAEPADPSCAPE